MAFHVPGWALTLRAPLPALLLALGLVASGARAADPPHLCGIHWYGDAASTDVENMAGGRALWVLETVWAFEKGFTFDEQAARLRAVAAKGHTVVIRVQPRFDQNVPDPSERARYLDALEAMARGAADFCHTWQLGNEQNLVGENRGREVPPAEYAAFYREARARIHRVASPLGPQRCLVAPVSPGEFYREVRFMEGWKFLQGVCDALPPAECDGFALHGYGAFWRDADGALEDMRACYRQQLHAIESRPGLSVKPAFILEWNRQTNPPTSATQQAESARFLFEGFRDLARWNADPPNHPVVCATWFIYPDDPAWPAFSILHAKSAAPRGARRNLWDAFRAASDLGLPAGASSGLAESLVVSGTSVTLEGRWTTGSLQPTRCMGPYWYRFPDGDAAAQAVFSVRAWRDGLYHALAWWPDGERSREARFEIVAPAEGVEAVVNQDDNGGRWNSLGTVRAKSGELVQVRLSGDSADTTRCVTADAVKFIFVE